MQRSDRFAVCERAVRRIRQREARIVIDTALPANGKVTTLDHRSAGERLIVKRLLPHFLSDPEGLAFDSAGKLYATKEEGLPYEIDPNTLETLGERISDGQARDIAVAIEARHPRLFTTEYRIANRPRGTVLLDFNQNAAGHTLAGAYSVRPTPSATVSTPLEWRELLEGAVPRDFTIVTVPMRLSQREDPWASARLDRARVELMEWREGMMGGGVRRAG